MHAIIRTTKGRRHEVNFDGLETTATIVLGEEVVEIVMEARQHFTPEHKQPLAVLNIPRSIFDVALSEGVRTGFKHPGAFLKLVKADE
ncbi:hypothetical protein [Solidesulfovibrio magneticus]|nr:hypothetical protein [Solidesulfovibrio magneticus]